MGFEDALMAVSKENTYSKKSSYSKLSDHKFITKGILIHYIDSIVKIVGVFISVFKTQHKSVETSLDKGSLTCFS